MGLGVATGSWVDSAGGRVVAHPVLGWRGVAVGQILAAAPASR